MILKGWIWKPVVAGSCASVVHFLFMYLKSRPGLLPSFQPYRSFQLALSQWVGANVPAIVPWALSFVNGMTILGFLIARMNRLLPGRKWRTGSERSIPCAKSSKNSKANRIETGEKSDGIQRNLFGGSRRKIAKKIADHRSS
jgi:hypothetical protein